MSNLLPLTAPAVEPVGLQEAKLFLRLDTSDEDTFVAACIVAARQACESFTGRALISQTWQLYLDQWPAQQILLPRPPLQAVTAIKTYDGEGVSTLVDPQSYWVDATALPGLVRRRGNAPWPRPGRAVAGIEITFVGGYGDSWNEVPAALRQGILMTVGYFFDHRDEQTTALPAPVAALWQPYRVMQL